jgi:putative transcriptional regulator
MGNLKPKLKIKNNLSILRAKKGITQQDLANSIGVTRATVNSMERGNYNPSLELAFRLSHYFKKDIQKIFQVEQDHE